MNHGPGHPVEVATLGEREAHRLAAVMRREMTAWRRAHGLVPVPPVRSVDATTCGHAEADTRVDEAGVTCCAACAAEARAAGAKS